MLFLIFKYHAFNPCSNDLLVLSRELDFTTHFKITLAESQEIT